MNNPNMPFLFFILVWVGMSILFSFWGGWRDLTQYYRYHGQLIDKKKYFQSAGMRGAMAYRGCLIIGASHEGLYLSVFFLFRIAHPPLFIPWSDIKSRSIRRFGYPLLEFTFSRVPTVFIQLPGTLTDFLKSFSPFTIWQADSGEAAQLQKGRTSFQWMNKIGIAIGIIAALLGILAAGSAFLFSKMTHSRSGTIDINWESKELIVLPEDPHGEKAVIKFWQH